MDPIYVTGHRNPDTDSIVAAIAYASLRNALGDREYTAGTLIMGETGLSIHRMKSGPLGGIFTIAECISQRCTRRS